MSYANMWNTEKCARKLSLVGGLIKIDAKDFATNVSEKINEKYKYYIEKNIPCENELYIAENHADQMVQGDNLVDWMQLHDKQQVIAIFDSIKNYDKVVTQEDIEYLKQKLSLLPKETTVREVLRKCGKFNKKRLEQVSFEVGGMEITGKKVESVYGTE